MKGILILIVLASLISCKADRSIGRFLPESSSYITSSEVVYEPAVFTDQTQTPVGTPPSYGSDITQSGVPEEPLLEDNTQGTQPIEGEEALTYLSEPQIAANLNLDNTTDFNISAGDIAILNITIRNDCKWYFRFEEGINCLLGMDNQTSINGIEAYVIFCLIYAAEGNYNLSVMCMNLDGQKVDMKDISYNVTAPTNKINVIRIEPDCGMTEPGGGMTGTSTSEGIGAV